MHKATLTARKQPTRYAPHRPGTRGCQHNGSDDEQRRHWRDVTDGERNDAAHTESAMEGCARRRLFSLDGFGDLFAGHEAWLHAPRATVW